MPTARSPVGRAVKGSLKDMRPDDLTVRMVEAAYAKVPTLSLRDDDLIPGCGQPAGEAGHLRRAVSVLASMDHLPGVTASRYCSSSLQTTRMAGHAIKAAEDDVFISFGAETVSRAFKDMADGLPDNENPVFTETVARTPKHAQDDADEWMDHRENGDLDTAGSSAIASTSSSPDFFPRRSGSTATQLPAAWGSASDWRRTSSP